MAIRTTGTGAALRIITKTIDGEVRVSCSCCEVAVCCPYEASQIGVLFGFDDMPQEINLAGGTGTLDVGPVETGSRESPSFNGEYSVFRQQRIYSGDQGVNLFRAVFRENQSTDAVPGAFDLETFYTLGMTEAIFALGTSLFPLGFSQPCLFTPNNTAVSDKYKDTYTLKLGSNPTIAGRAFNGALMVGISLDALNNATLTRTGLCTWESEEFQAPDISGDAFGGFSITGITGDARLSLAGRSGEWFVTISVFGQGSFPAANFSGGTGLFASAQKEGPNDKPEGEYESIRGERDQNISDGVTIE